VIIFHKSANIDEIAKLHLIESNCLPILTYAFAAIKLMPDQMQEMNKAWNCAYRKIFGFNMWESVKLLICGLGRSDSVLIRLKPYINFLRCNMTSNNLTLKYLLIRNALSDSDSLCKRCSMHEDIENLVFNNRSNGHVIRLIHD